MEYKKIPEHIAIIMDGNGRWAKERGVPRNEGHRRGTKTLENIIKYAEKIGVKYLTVYAFSTENWKRPKTEVDGLMDLFEKYLDDNIKKAKKSNQKFMVLGDIEDTVVPERIRGKINKLQDITKDHSGICFNMAFNYGGRNEIVRACKKIMGDMLSEKIGIDELSEEVFSNYLDTKEVPDPDFMIRTSGEIRTSNFLPWQLTYAEFYFADCMWPDFDEKEFDKAINVFGERQRRFGKSE